MLSPIALTREPDDRADEVVRKQRAYDAGTDEPAVDSHHISLTKTSIQGYELVMVTAIIG